MKHTVQYTVTRPSADGLPRNKCSDCSSRKYPGNSSGATYINIRCLFRRTGRAKYRPYSIYFTWPCKVEKLLSMKCSKLRNSYGKSIAGFDAVHNLTVRKPQGNLRFGARAFECNFYLGARTPALVATPCLGYDRLYINSCAAVCHIDGTSTNANGFAGQARLC